MSVTLDFPLPVPRARSTRSIEIARWFGLDSASAPKFDLAQLPLPAAGQVLLIAGPSGSGKSHLLRHYRRRMRRCGRWIDLPAIALPRKPVIDCFGEFALEEALRRLSRVGLAEAWTYLRLPRELSDGQRWRLRLAIAMRQAEPSPAVIVADEFGALLDRITARIVAHCLRRTIDRLPGARAIVATSHDDLEGALRPDLIAQCDFGKVEIRAAQPPPAVPHGNNDLNIKQT